MWKSVCILASCASLLVLPSCKNRSFNETKTRSDALDSTPRLGDPLKVEYAQLEKMLENPTPQAQETKIIVALESTPLDGLWSPHAKAVFNGFQSTGHNAQVLKFQVDSMGKLVLMDFTTGAPIASTQLKNGENAKALLLILSDFTSAHWGTSAGEKALVDMALLSSVVLAPLLPESLWSQTHLKSWTDGSSKSDSKVPEQGLDNFNLSCEMSTFEADLLPEPVKPIGLPVLKLREELKPTKDLGTLKTLIGRSGSLSGALCKVLDTDEQSLSRSAEKPNGALKVATKQDSESQHPSLSPEQRASLFSVSARRVAVPLLGSLTELQSFTIADIQTIQKEFLSSNPLSGDGVVAEVLLSGLLTVDETATDSFTFLSAEVRNAVVNESRISKEYADKAYALLKPSASPPRE